MAFTQLPSFTQDVSMLPDNPALTPAQLKAQFDAAPSQLLTYFNNLITALKQTTNGDSGAKNVGATTIGSMIGNDVQTLLAALDARATKLEAVPVIQTPTFLNNWVDNSPGVYPSQFWKDANGIVHFYLCVKNGSTAANVVVCNLPAGYAPNANKMLRGYIDGTTSGNDLIYHVATNGEVKFLRTFTQSFGAFIILEGSYKAA